LPSDAVAIIVNPLVSWQKVEGVMPDRQFIHSTADVSTTLKYALELGMQIIQDQPQTAQRPRMLTWEQTCLNEGVFYLIHPEWMFGAFQMTAISGGYNRGKYSLQPRVNHAAVSLYFGGERVDQGRRRLGNCVVSWHRDWLEFPARVVKPTPPEVRKFYKRIVARLSSGIVVKRGVHRYHVSRTVLADPSASACLPPFDFIPWGDEVFKRPVQ
jgi:hypothetical protein